MSNTRISPKRKKQLLFIASVLFIPLLMFLIFYVYINLQNFGLAFQSIDYYGNKTWVGLENFKDFFDGLKNDSQVGLSVKNSLKIWALSFGISMPLYLIFSYYIFRKYIGAGPFSIIVMLPEVISGFVFALIYSKFVETALPSLMKSWYSVEKFPQLIFDERYAFGNNIFYSIWLSFGTSTLIYSNAMRAIDDEIFESARLDGASDSQEFFHIVLPLIWPTLSTFIVTGVGGMFTASGSLMAFYMMDAPPSIWGFGYYISRMVKTDTSMGSYSLIAASGLAVSLMTIPITFTVKWLTEKLDKTE